MKHRFLAAWGSALVLIIPAVVACSSSDSSNTTKDGGAGTGGSSGTGGSGATGGSAGASGSAGAAGASGKCLDQADYTALDACYGTAGDKTYQAIATQCGVDCILSGDNSDQCILTCLQSGTNNAVSDACAGCVVSSVACGRDICAAKCVASPTGPDCVGCICGNNTAKRNCIQEYMDCSGRPNTTCTTGPTTCPHDGG